jgi:hypothetical protein
VRFRSSPPQGRVLQTRYRSHRLSLPGARARGRSEIAALPKRCTAVAAGTLRTPDSDSNREPSRSKRDTSTKLGYRGKLVRAVGFEPTLPRLSTSCLLPIGLRAHGAAPRIRTETLTRFKLASSAIGIEPRRPFRCCPGFSGVRDRRLSWWSNGREIGSPPRNRTPIASSKGSRPAIERAGIKWKRAPVPPRVFSGQSRVP